jgi:hypothetical protein
VSKFSIFWTVGILKVSGLKLYIEMDSNTDPDWQALDVDPDPAK